MLKQLRNLPVRGSNQIFDAGILDPEPQWKRVAAHPQRPLHIPAGLRSSQQLRAKYGLFTAAGVRNDQPPGSMAQRRGADSQMTRPSSHPSRQRRINRLAHRLDLATVTTHIHQTKWRRRLLNHAKLLAEELVCGLRTGMCQGLCYADAIRHRAGKVIGTTVDAYHHLGK
jgi:hypothetical protein